MILEMLFINVLPLYGLIGLGFLMGKYAKLNVDPIATLMLYGILPVVMFGATATMAFTIDFFLPPLIIASISIIASMIAYNGAGIVWGNNDKRKNLLGLLNVSANATYFGVPIAIAMAGQEWLGVYIVMVSPLFILDCTLSYYYGVRGDFSVKNSLIRVAKLPIIYGVIAGFAVNLCNIDLPPLLLDYWSRFTGTMIVLGMIMIGTAFSKMEKFRFDWAFFYGVSMLRYIIWPTLGILWIFVDLTYIKALPDTIHSFIILICACPLAANTVAYATKLNLYPTLTSCMVLITTLLALAFIPLMLWLQTILFI